MKDFKNFSSKEINEHGYISPFTEHTNHLIRSINKKVQSYGIALVGIKCKIDSLEDDTYSSEIYIGNFELSGKNYLLKVYSHINDSQKSKNTLTFSIGNKKIINETGNKIAEQGVDLSDATLTKLVKEILFYLGVKVK